MAATALADLGPLSNTPSKASIASSRRFGEKQREKRAKSAPTTTPAPGAVLPVFRVVESSRVAEVLTGT